MRALDGLRHESWHHASVVGRVRRAWRRYRARRRGLRDLRCIERAWRADGDDARAVEALSRILRRTAVAVADDRPVGGITGERWLSFLDRSGNTERFTRGAGRVLISAPYQHGDDPDRREVDVAALIALARRWMRRARVRS